MGISIYLGLLVTLSCYSGAMLGGAISKRLPEDYLCNNSRDTIKLGVGLIATMTALILGLLTASSKGVFDAVDKSIRQTAADVLLLDRTLANYGSETDTIRLQLKRLVEKRTHEIWPEQGEVVLDANTKSAEVPIEELAHRIRKLQAQNDEQKWLQQRAIKLSDQVLEARWLVLAGLSNSVSQPFLVALTVWLAVTFTTFGLLAPQNAVVRTIIGVCALTVGSAVFLIQEMEQPFDGAVRVSPASLHYAIERLNR